MGFILVMFAAIALCGATASAEPIGLRVGPDVILEPITDMPLRHSGSS